MTSWLCCISCVFFCVFDGSISCLFETAERPSSGRSIPRRCGTPSGFRPTPRKRSSERDDWVQHWRGHCKLYDVFVRGTFGALPLTYFCIPKSTRAYFFSNLSKLIPFAAAPLVLTPFVRSRGALPRPAARELRAAGAGAARGAGLGPQGEWKPCWRKPCWRKPRLEKYSYLPSGTSLVVRPAHLHRHTSAARARKSANIARFPLFRGPAAGLRRLLPQPRGGDRGRTERPCPRKSDLIDLNRSE